MHPICRGIAASAILLLLAACQPKTADRPTGSGDIVIGATLPLSGALQGFGSFQKWGYEHAVAEINAAGGIAIDGVQRKVRLIIRDDKTDANVAASNIDTLISADQAVALLGSCTPRRSSAAVRRWSRFAAQSSGPGPGICFSMIQTSPRHPSARSPT
jgi:branched-chain amino acid transport system substrate-binding protein